ncbi:MAG: type II toxin-antitoxin system HicB family antitoxin [Candidatus Gracilibacteria bacterium]
MSFLALFTQEDDGRFSVSVPALPGCFSQGETLEEAKENIQEAIGLYLEDDDLKKEVFYNTQMVVSIDVPLKKYA